MKILQFMQLAATVRQVLPDSLVWLDRQDGATAVLLQTFKSYRISKITDRLAPRQNADDRSFSVAVDGHTSDWQVLLLLPSPTRNLLSATIESGVRLLLAQAAA